MDKLLDMVATEAFEERAIDHHPNGKTKAELPLLRYDLELIKQPDGSYTWVE